MNKDKLHHHLYRRLVGIVAAVVVLAPAIVFFAHSWNKSESMPFVERTGSELTIDGKPFRFAGTDMPWLGLDEAISDEKGQPTYPTRHRIENGFTAAKNMHATVVRSHSLGISTGNAWSIEPALGVFNDKAFEPIDRAVETAAGKNIRLIVPLTDMWRYKTGGKHNFTEWAGYASLPSQTPGVNLDANDAQQRAIEHNFYTDQKVVQSYKEYIHHVLDHKDPKTGVALKDNPAILAWETGNELWDSPPEWNDDIAQFIKEVVGAKQLVADGTGSSGTSDTGARLANMGAALTNVHTDMLTTHIYTNIGGTSQAPFDVEGTAFFRQAAQDVQQDAAVAKEHNKVYYVGEFNWTGGANDTTWRTQFSSAALMDFLSAIESNHDVAGDLYWTLFPYREDGTPEIYGERFWMLNPPIAGDAQMGSGNAALSAHAAAMTRSTD